MLTDAQTTERLAQLEASLNDFDPQVRRAALDGLLQLAEHGAVPRPAPAAAANMHCHTFFSFNAYGHSPTSLAWLARQRGWQAVGIVDFDVLDAVDEFLAACDAVGVRGTAAIETRIHLPAYATREINSPGEPGVAYHLAIGFASSAVPEEVRGTLAGLRERAARRNRDVMARVNAYLDPVTIDYERDVLPLTPAGNATERHMLVAYMRAAEKSLADPARFWAEKLDLPVEQVQGMLHDAPKLQNLMRGRLMKRGGVGYVQPSPDSFPTLAELQRLITACGALSCIGWLDGTSAGEADARKLVEFWVANGAVTLNIIPDRNWNIADPETRRVKTAKLYEIVDLAAEYQLPLNVGTEMNSYGNKLVDNFDAPELAPVREAFLDGAYFVYGHTALQRAQGLGYLSPWATAHLPGRGERVAFYTRLGRLLRPGPTALARLRAPGNTLEPQDILRELEQ